MRTFARLERERQMAASNINRVVLTGNLTRDPELRSLPSGTSVCRLRIASNTRRKDEPAASGSTSPTTSDVTVWGAQGENCARYLAKGRPVAIDGRLEWREWTPRRHQAPGGRDHRRRRPVPRRRSPRQGGGFTPRSDVPVDTSDFQPAPVGGGGGGAPAADDDIPF